MCEKRVRDSVAGSTQFCIVCGREVAEGRKALCEECLADPAARDAAQVYVLAQVSSDFERFKRDTLCWAGRVKEQLDTLEKRLDALEERVDNLTYNLSIS